MNEGTDDRWRARTNRSSEDFSKNFSLFHLCAVDLRTDHRAKGDFGTELLRDGQGQGGFSGSRGADEKEGTPGEFTRLDKVHDNAAGLGGDTLTIGFHPGRDERGRGVPLWRLSGR